MSVLVTGAAGFIGFHVAAAQLARGEQVIGTAIEAGVPRFVEWCREYHRI